MFSTPRARIKNPVYIQKSGEIHVYKGKTDLHFTGIALSEKKNIWWREISAQQREKSLAAFMFLKALF